MTTAELEAVLEFHRNEADNGSRKCGECMDMFLASFGWTAFTAPPGFYSCPAGHDENHPCNK